VADLRAPTPSAAAELVVPERMELLTKINNLKKRAIAGYGRYMADRKKCLTGLQERFKDPRRLLIDLQIHLDDLQQRIHRDMNHQRQYLGNKLQKLELSLKHQSPEEQVQVMRILLNNLQKDTMTNWRSYWTAHYEHLQKNAAVLDSLSPLAVLQRGYSITHKLPSGEIVRQAVTLKINEEVNIQLAKGNFNAKVEKIYGE
jgi:exodeoxyribonuclease VII large subunit